MFLTATWHLDSFDKALKHISKQKPDVDVVLIWMLIFYFNKVKQKLEGDLLF